jgi:hypothetical protein
MSISPKILNEVVSVAENWQQKIQVSREPEEEKLHALMKKC